PDGKIIAVGYSGGFRLVRFNADGSFDADFGSSGQVLYSTSGGTPKIARQADGKIIVADLYVGGLILVRFDVNGMLDTSFGTNGSVITPTQSKLNSTSDIALQKNGKILVVGVYFRQPIPPFGSDFSVFRFNPNGSLDTSFGNAGIVLTRFDGSQYDIARTLVIQPNGKIVVAGSSLSDVSKFALVRYEGDQNIRPSFDFDGDGKSDISVYRPSSGVWYLLNSSSGFTAAQFGVSTDKIVPADYDGDGKTDIAVYRSGTWYLSRSSAGFTGIAFGEASDILQPADFDGDGKAELAVYRPSNGTWYVLNLAANHHSNFQFGASTDKPVIADYDGDGKADYAVYRPSSGTWYLQRSTAGFTGVQFGEATDKPVPADYDGDGKTDIAVFRPSNGVWYLNRSTQGFTGIQFGVSTDLPTPAEYDGDGKADIAVFRNGTWYLQQTTAGFTGVGFGESTDKPVPNTFVP
ncbi:MAG: FG-GAP-like repeat-containing protein, partial [Acidobacteriota bacterium]